MVPKKLFVAVVIVLLAVSGSALAQTLKNMTHPAPDGAFISFQLTDGTVMVQGENWSDWWKLTPDSSGSYLKGTWTQLASLPSDYVPYAFASAVLADGRLLIMGGEYSDGGDFTLTNQGAIYDPLKNTWKKMGHPKGWGYIGDSPSSVLADGTYLIGRKTTKQGAVLDPKTLTWTEVAFTGKADFNAEEGWTLMPDGTVLTADVKKVKHSEIYDPATQAWTSAGSTKVDLHNPYQGGCIPYGNNKEYCPPGEIGPAILRPDGTVFQTGSYSVQGPGHTAIYTPAAGGGIGTWKVGPDFPNDDNAGDSFASLLPNGKVLVAGVNGYLYEFDGKNFNNGIFGYGCLMVLPTGETLVGGSQLYSTTGTYKASWAPKITNFPSTVTRGSTYKISGKQFNGLSQAASFGDEFETATNYPLVRITNQSSGHVFYARTHDHSSMGVATGSLKVTTSFDVPSNMETGASSLEVVANGIPSPAVSITVN